MKNNLILGLVSAGILLLVQSIQAQALKNGETPVKPVDVKLLPRSVADAALKELPGFKLTSLYWFRRLDGATLITQWGLIGTVDGKETGVRVHARGANGEQVTWAKQESDDNIKNFWKAQGDQNATRPADQAAAKDGPTGGAAEEKPKAHQLPADAKSPVIVLDRSGGMMRRVNQEPVLEVLSNGTALVGDPFGLGRRVEGKLRPEELQSVLRYILDEMKFSEIKAEDLKTKPQKNGMIAMVSDGTTTTVTVEADGKRQQTGGYAVETVAQQDGAGSAAERFVKIDARLSALVRVITLGGPEGVKKQLDAANAKLKTELSDESPMQDGDLMVARATAPAGTVATFSRKTILPNKKWHTTAVTVTADAKGDLKVQVMKGADMD